MSNILIAYGTRYGATAGTAEEIAKILTEHSHKVNVVNLKKEKIKSIAEYDTIIAATGMQIGQWTSQVKNFIRKFKNDFADKRLIIVVSSGGKNMPENEDDPQKRQEMQSSCLNEKIAKYDLHPMESVIFGGVWDFEHFPFWAGMAKAEIKKQIDSAGIKEIRLGFYDTRNWERIRTWAHELADKL